MKDKPMSVVRLSRFKPSVRVLLLGVVFLGVTEFAFAATPPPSEVLAALADRFIEARLDHNPIMAMSITGDARYEDKFVNDLTPEFRATQHALFTDTLNALKKIDNRRLSESDRLTRAVLEYQLRSGLERAGR